MDLQVITKAVHLGTILLSFILVAYLFWVIYLPFYKSNKTDAAKLEDIGKIDDPNKRGIVVGLSALILVSQIGLLIVQQQMTV